MPVTVSLSPRRQRLELHFSGNLDITVARPVCKTCGTLPPWVSACVLDLTRVDRIFDSGVALLHMLCRRLAGQGAQVSIRGGLAELRRWPELSRLIV